MAKMEGEQERQATLLTTSQNKPACPAVCNQSLQGFLLIMSISQWKK